MTLLVTVFNVIFPIVLIATAGYWYSKKNQPQMQFINNANMDLFAPALIFSALTGAEWSLSENLPLLGGAVFVVLGSGLLTLPLCKALAMDKRVLLPPTMFNNSANLGVPLLIFSFGNEVLPQAVLLYMCCSLLHFSLGLAIVNSNVNLLKQFTRPNLIAAILAILFSTQGWQLPLALDRAIDLMGQIAIPLMIFALGSRLTSMPTLKLRTPLIAGLWIPAVGLIMAIIYLQLSTTTPLQTNLLLLFSILPPAVFNFLVAERYLKDAGMKGEVAEIVLWGNVLAIFPIALLLMWIFTR